MPGNYPDSNMDIHRGTLFLTTGGINRVLYPGTNRLLPADGNGNVPAKVEVIDNWLIGLNRDNSISVWERATGELTLNFYLFDDLNWAAVTRFGRVVTSNQKASSYIKQY
jgi:hypothetical protein